MFVDVLLSIPLIPEKLHAFDEERVVCVAADILRATTVMVTALDVGVSGIIPVSSPEEALRIGQVNPAYVLAGEVGGLPPEGFHFGNSPVEILTRQAEIQNKTVVMSTTNGTRLLKLLEAKTQAGRDRIVIGALVNRAAVCHEILRAPFDRIYLCCAGQKGKVAIEDVAFAGYVLQLLQIMTENSLLLGDGARIALALVNQYESPMAIFQTSHHGQRLITLGLDTDLSYCSALDKTDRVPEYVNGQVGI